MHALWRGGQEGEAWTTKEELRERRDAATSAENAPTGYGPGTALLLLFLVLLREGLRWVIKVQFGQGREFQ